MSKQISQYEMLKDVHNIVSRVEKKWDKRLSETEDRIDTVENIQQNLLGKIGVGIMVVAGFISAATTLVVEFIKKRI